MTELVLEVDLEEERRLEMYDELCRQFGEDEVDAVLEEQILRHITQMFDNRDRLKRMGENQ